MGVFKMFSSGSDYEPKQDSTPEPNPHHFKVLQKHCEKNTIALVVSYDHCTTFEGKKVLVIKGTVVPKTLDPHFSEDGIVVARFKPTMHGWFSAKVYADSYSCLIEHCSELKFCDLDKLL